MSTKKLKELHQGVIQEALPDLDDDDAAPRYPAVIQGAKNNMIKFSNCVVLTRVGNFYELYLEHAEQYAPLLNLKLGSKKTNAGPVAMAGFPFFQLDRFLKILVQDLNKYVAISEEFPSSVAGKVKSGGLLFDRRVARVVTPGTLIDEKFIDPYENNFLLAVHVEEDRHVHQNALSSSFLSGGYEPSMVTLNEKVGLAWLDLSTGDFFTQITTMTLLPSGIARINPREIILDESLAHRLKTEIEVLLGDAHHLITYHKCKSEFVSMAGWNSMLETPVLEVAESTFTEEEKIAGHRILDYTQTRLLGLEMKLQPPRRRQTHESMTIDRSSLRGLEILETARDGLGKGSLFNSIRRTTTKSGARLLHDRVTSPSASLPEINMRLDLVTAVLEDAELRQEIIQLLRRSYDAQRLVQKFSLNKGDADDMICLARAINASHGIRSVLEEKLPNYGAHYAEALSDETSASLHHVLSRIDLDGPGQLSERIMEAIDEEGLSQQHQLEEYEAASVAALAQEAMRIALPQELEDMPKRVRSARKLTDSKEQESGTEEPWIMCRSASSTLCRLHEDLDSLKQERLDLAQTLRVRLSAPSLTLKWTPGLGHICHIKGTSKVPLEEVNARVVSSTKSTKSFYLTDWSRLGGRMDQTRVHIRNEEQRIFSELRYQVIKNLVKLRRNAAVLDELDVACSFATLAEEQSFVRPILDLGISHKVVGGRHPTVKLGLEEQGRPFVSNDLFLGEQERVWLVTGPNMGGKSTFLRQNALISILAQVGSYVPAEHAQIGLVDQMFSRIGAADDLFRDQSTFMVEMLETAAILKQATPRSFVIMDEVGRGTTPEDGTAIGFACLHHLYHVNKCRTLFATHFHSLADMTHEFENLGRYCTDVLEDECGSFSFVHRLRPGVNKHSHALKVARLAGLPESTVNIARDVLSKLLEEKSQGYGEKSDPSSKQPLLSAAAG